MKRLQKYISECGIASRRKAEELITSGKVSVNGEVVTTLGTKINETDVVMVNNKLIKEDLKEYYLLYKPREVISSVKDDKNRKTVCDLIKTKTRIFPVGRLDKDTEGLLLITNDGPLAHTLLSPKHHVEKEYYVEHALDMSEDDIVRLQSGISYNGESYKPAKVNMISPRSCTLTITEGKYHEIKFMFQALGDKVTYLKRLRMKNLVLDESLKLGEYRYLTEEEIADLKADEQ